MTEMEKSSKPWQEKYTFLGRFSSTTKLSLVHIVALMTLDLLIYMGTIIFIYDIASKTLLQPIHRGFSCNDPYIQNPLHPNTVSTRYLLVVTLAGPFFVIFGSYFLEYYNGKNLFSTEMYSRIFKVTFFVYLDYVIAFGIVTVALEFIKCATGRLRPNFLNMCRPNLTICENDPEAFIEEYECDPILTKYDRNSKMSFPSGHAAAAAFAQLFIWYFLKSAVLNGNFKEQNLILMRKFKRYVIIFYSFFAVICAMTRIFDCWHFPSDVLGGVLTALVFFYATLWKYTKFQKKKKNEEHFSKKK